MAIIHIEKEIFVNISTQYCHNFIQCLCLEIEGTISYLAILATAQKLLYHDQFRKLKKGQRNIHFKAQEIFTPFFTVNYTCLEQIVILVNSFQYNIQRNQTPNEDCL